MLRAPSPPRAPLVGTFAAEAPKVLAFLRRDLLIALSYRTAFVAEIGGIVVQAITFYFVGRMVDPSVLPAYDGSRATYMQFVTVGIALGMFMVIGLGQVAASVRGEQLMGTLESVLLTPTASATIQIGSVAYQLLFIPIRTMLFIVLIALLFDLDFALGGIGPALLVILAFLPFVWGLGLVSAAGILAFKRGSAGVGLGVTLLTLASGVYFPLHLLPGWVETLAEVNPLALAIEGLREALIGGAGLADLAPDLLVLIPASVVSLAAGVAAWRTALKFERRRGSLALY